MAKVTEEYYAQKRKEILDAAYRVCVRKPITSVTMKDVIAETGYSHGAIYKYYKDLDEIIRDLLININRTYTFDDLGKIIEKHGTKNWEKAIRDISSMLADHMIGVGKDVVKISLYCGVFAMSEPERAKQISEKIGEESVTPLLSAINTMSVYLEDIIKANKLHPARSAEEIILFIVTYYGGVEDTFALSDDEESSNGFTNGSPKLLFSILADSIILMLKGVNKK